MADKTFRYGEVMLEFLARVFEGHHNKIAKEVNLAGLRILTSADVERSLAIIAQVLADALPAGDALYSVEQGQRPTSLNDVMAAAIDARDFLYIIAELFGGRVDTESADFYFEGKVIARANSKRDKDLTPAKLKGIEAWYYVEKETEKERARGVRRPPQKNFVADAMRRFSVSRRYVYEGRKVVLARRLEFRRIFDQAKTVKPRPVRRVDLFGRRNFLVGSRKSDD